MSLIGGLLEKVLNLNKQNFSTESEEKSKKTLSEKTIDLISNGLMCMFFFLYVIHIDNYIPETYDFKNILKIVASTFLVLSFMALVVNVLEFLNRE